MPSSSSSKFMLLTGVPSMRERNVQTEVEEKEKEEEEQEGEKRPRFCHSYTNSASRKWKSGNLSNSTVAHLWQCTIELQVATWSSLQLAWWQVIQLIRAVQVVYFKCEERERESKEPSRKCDQLHQLPLPLAKISSLLMYTCTLGTQ